MSEIKWPNGKKCAAFFGFDVDAEIIWHNMSRDEKNGDKFLRSLSNGKAGPKRCLPRILDLLREYGLKATFFVPGWTAEHYPGLLEELLKEGHEIAHHGYTHESFTGLPVAQQTEILERSLSIFEKQTGVKGIGFRAPSSDWDRATPKILRDLGFSYSSTMRADDRPYRTVIDGVESDFIEIPTAAELDDYSYTVYSIIPKEPAGLDRIAGFADVYDNYLREFEGYYRFGLCYPPLLHPQVSGAAGRILILEELIKRILEKGDVWVATGEEIAAHWRETY
ncbi:polysaccharide deacetylase [Oscillospiraceae bacterium OttesenSCG-928-G22]|nr:polysaccharide deacetylase [Oscillospiraceae bacterium OttesenSCG-928-G22]